jgi:hypothetical protein
MKKELWRGVLALAVLSLPALAKQAFHSATKTGKWYAITR